MNTMTQRVKRTYSLYLNAKPRNSKYDEYIFLTPNTDLSASIIRMEGSCPHSRLTFKYLGAQ